MNPQAYRRLEESQPLQRPLAIVSGLWRRGHLRALQARERRRYIRIATDDRARMATLDAPNNPVDIRVLDVSRGGLRVATRTYFGPGTLVRVELGGTGVFAEVRHSALVDAAFHSGLEIQGVVMRH